VNAKVKQKNKGNGKRQKRQRRPLAGRIFKQRRSVLEEFVEEGFTVVEEATDDLSSLTAVG
jgi:hypothetical protein